MFLIMNNVNNFFFSFINNNDMITKTKTKILI